MTILKGRPAFSGPSFSLGNRIRRAVWNVVWCLLFLPSPRGFHAWRAFLLRLFGATIGPQCHIYPRVRIWAPWQLRTGCKVGIANGVNLYNMADIDIGDYCVISQGAHLCGGSHDIDSPDFQLVASPIRLDRYVWVCAEAFVGPGVHLPEGVVIGARAVLMRSVPEPWSVWAGNPASFRRTRSPAVRQ